MYLELDHHLCFEYSSWIRESHMEIRVEPLRGGSQRVLDFDLAVGPTARPTRSEDWLGNALHWFSITDYHQRIEVCSRSLVETTGPAFDPFSVDDPVASQAAAMATWDFLQFDGPVIDSERLQSLGKTMALDQAPNFGVMLQRLCDELRNVLTYEQHVTGALSTSDDALKAGAGVCQDFAHIAIGLLRGQGIPARYVNGYLHVEHDEDTPSQSHAWVEAFAPGPGWVPFDPTHGSAVGERHVLVAHGRSYADVPPNRGVFRGEATETLSASVRTRIVDTPARRRAIAPMIAELPTFSEAPDEAASSRRRSDEAAASQQQQQ
ncbi:MAG: transglutaminase family protein [Phycisphaerales bacterium]|nr:transglutaminase family protein [Phycisphaerales bacterium]